MSRFRDLLEEWLAGIFFMIGCGLVVYGVIMRYIVHTPVFWVDEISTYLLLWGILLGWSMAEKDGRHICVGLLYDFISERWQYRISIFEKICSILFSGFLVIASVTLWLHYMGNAQVSTNAQIRLWIVYLIMPVSTILFFVRFVEETINLLRGGIEALREAAAKGGGH